MTTFFGLTYHSTTRPGTTDSNCENDWQTNASAARVRATMLAGFQHYAHERTLEHDGSPAISFPQQLNESNFFFSAD
jgi:hypothetical protein